MEKYRGLRIAGFVLLVLSLCWCWVTGAAVAYGWIAHADHYGAVFRGYGITVFIGLGLLTLGAVLCACRRDLPAAVCGTAGAVPVFTVLLLSMQKAEENSWSGQTAQSFGRQASAVWRNGLAPVLLPLLLLLLLALTRFFSYSARTERAQKRDARENRPAPSILGGSTDAPLREDATKTPANRQEKTRGGR